jgi:hypothetical protein
MKPSNVSSGVANSVSFVPSSPEAAGSSLESIQKFSMLETSHAPDQTIPNSLPDTTCHPEAAAKSDENNSEKGSKANIHLLVGVAVLVSMYGAQKSPDLAEARSKGKPVNSKVQNAKPKLLPVMRFNSRSKCSSKTRMTLSLRGAKTPDKSGKNNYQIIAKSCKGKKEKPLKNIRLVVSGPPKEGQKKRQKKSWKIKNPSTGNKGNRRNFSFSQSGIKTDQISQNQVSKNKLQLSAYNRQGRQTAKTIYLPKTGKPSYEDNNNSHSENVQSPESCKPHPDFRIGAQYDRGILYQEGMSTQTAAGLLNYTLGATAIRINVIPAQVEELGGLTRYVEAIKSAGSQGIEEVLATVMPNPIYMDDNNPGQPNAGNFGSNGKGKEAMYSFARRVSTTFGTKIGNVAIRYSAINEGNHPYFSLNHTSSGVEFYKSGYMAAYNGIKDGTNNTATVATGEHAPSDNIIFFLKASQSVPNDGTNLHTYGSHNDRIDEFDKIIDKEITVSEDGAFGSDPDQINTAAKRLRVAWCAGVRGYYLYNPIEHNTGKNDKPRWDTDFLHVNGDNSKAKRAFATALQP